MHDHDVPPDHGTDERGSTTRRAVLSVAALGCATAGLGGVVGSSRSPAVRRFELGARVDGWTGRRPPAIEGRTNPTLPMAPGRTHAVTWENLDGVAHNLVVEEADGTPVVESEIVSEAGATRTVEFTPTEATAAYYCVVHPNSMRGDVSLVAATPTATPSPTPGGTPRGTPEPPADVAFEPDVVEEQRGDVATFTLSLGDADRAAVSVGDRGVSYVVAFTVVDGNGDGEVTVALDTFVAGRGERPGVGAVADEDEVRNYRQETPTLTSPLDASFYPLRAYDGGRLVADGVLVLSPRQTRAARAAVAPRTATPSRPTAFRERTTRRDEVATGDWAVLEVEASGLYATLDGVDAFEDESLGYELSIEQPEEDVLNDPPDVVPLEDVRLLVDADADRFLAAVDSTTLRQGATYEASFAITDANPYVPRGERERVAAAFSVVERTATYDVAGEGLAVPAGTATLAGTTTVAPGTTITVAVRGSGERPFQRVARPTVADDGTWSATFDFSDLDPGTEFTTWVLGLSDRVGGVVRSGGASTGRRHGGDRTR